MGDGELLNEVIVRNGYAWHYRVKAQENPTLSNQEYQASKLKLGLWVQPSPLPPCVRARRRGGGGGGTGGGTGGGGES